MKTKKMKLFFLTTILSLFSLCSFSQKGYQLITREDGTKIKVCNTDIVSYDNTTQIGLNVMSNIENNFVSVTLRFKHSVKQIIENLNIRLQNNKMIKLKLINSQKSFIGNSEVAQALYEVTEKQRILLMNSSIHTISLKLDDTLIRTYEAKKNSDILMKQFIAVTK